MLLIFQLIKVNADVENVMLLFTPVPISRTKFLLRGKFSYSCAKYREKNRDNIEKSEKIEKIDKIENRKLKNKNEKSKT